MITLSGESVLGKIAIGKLFFYKRQEWKIKRRHVEDVENEVKRFERAKEQTAAELCALYERVIQNAGETHAMIFEVHKMILEDVGYVDSIVNMLMTQEVNAEYAVQMTANDLVSTFSAMEDVYMQERAADIRDVSEHLLRTLLGEHEVQLQAEEPVILAGEDLSPSEMAELNCDKILGLATRRGSLNSHTAILAKTKNIPVLVGVGEMLSPDYDGHMAVLDGMDGKLYIDPNEELLRNIEEKQGNDLSHRALLNQLKKKENRTKSGQKIDIYANIGSVEDVDAVLDNDAGGIGLFRSEFLYLESRTFPTEEQQFLAYKVVAQRMEGKKVIIRTMDIGADKQAGYFGLEKEENPAMGYRGIRICLTQPEIFAVQLRAIYRAAMFGNIAIMFPMITSVWEIQRIKSMIEEVKQGMRQEKVVFKERIELGIMIETPAAVMISRELAKEVDFFSVGTNDLTQYTLAVDRQNPTLNMFFDGHHPAILAMIQMVADSAHAEGKWIGICGELGADVELTEIFLKMGIDELSVAPSMILPIRARIREVK